MNINVLKWERGFKNIIVDGILFIIYNFKGIWISKAINTYRIRIPIANFSFCHCRKRPCLATRTTSWYFPIPIIMPSYNLQGKHPINIIRYKKLKF